MHGSQMIYATHAPESLGIKASDRAEPDVPSAHAGAVKWGGGVRGGGSPAGKYTRSMVLLTGLLLAGGGVAPAGQGAAAWRQVPEYLALFAPAGPRRDAYETFVSALDLDAVLERLKTESGVLTPPGAWEARPELPSDAFGQTGRYDRWKMAELYGARRARVARGPRGEGTRVTEVWTLVSPYPDPTLTRLEPGTLLIVLRIP